MGSVSVVRVETDGAKLLPDAHQTPRCVPKPLPCSLLHSIHPCLAIKDPMDLIRWLLCSSWMQGNCFYPPTLSSYDVGTIAQALLFLDWKQSDEKMTKRDHICMLDLLLPVLTSHRNVDELVADSLYPPLFYVAPAKNTFCQYILRMSACMRRFKCNFYRCPVTQNAISGLLMHYVSLVEYTDYRNEWCMWACSIVCA